MAAFQLALMILGNILAAHAANGGQNSQAVTSAIEKLTDLYNALRAAASQNAELTPEQEQILDSHATAVFASASSDPSQNT